jgi:hypothetical protein
LYSRGPYFIPEDGGLYNDDLKLNPYEEDQIPLSEEQVYGGLLGGF